MLLYTLNYYLNIPILLFLFLFFIGAMNCMKNSSVSHLQKVRMTSYVGDFNEDVLTISSASHIVG